MIADMTPPPSPGANACTICGVADIHTQQTASTPPAYAHMNVRMCIDALKSDRDATAQRCAELEQSNAMLAEQKIDFERRLTQLHKDYDAVSVVADALNTERDALKARCATLESQVAAYAGAPVLGVQHTEATGSRRVLVIDNLTAKCWQSFVREFGDTQIELIARPSSLPRASCVWTREDLPSNHGHRTACGSWYSISATFCLGNPDSDVPLYCPDCGRIVEVANAPVTVSTPASKEDAS